LKRARHQKPQYLVIRATTLVDTGRPELAVTALNLIELFVQEHYEPFFGSGAFHTKARAFVMLTRWEEAFQAFEEALTARRAAPGVIDNARLEYPLTIARRRARDRYQRALEILNEFVGPTELVFPIQQFQYFATLALIAADEGDPEGASRWAKNALAGDGKTSPVLAPS
jgi:tetratricopeptide (TPR) repeat protein